MEQRPPYTRLNRWLNVEYFRWQAESLWPDKLSESYLWHWLFPQRKILRLCNQISIAVVILICLWYLTSRRQAISPLVLLRPSSSGSSVAAAVQHIPRKIWQIYLDFSPELIAPYQDQIMSWITRNPSYDYTIIDKDGAISMMSNLQVDPHNSQILPLFYAMSRRVIRGDFLRYLLLATEGGIYSDMDTELLKPIDFWIPEEFKAATHLIVGLEADQSPPVWGTTYEVQFCQWTLAAAPNHPAMWEMVNNVLEQVQHRPYQIPPLNVEYSDEEVLDISGPAGWTRVVYRFLSEAAGAPIDWRNLTGLTEPRLYGDILVLPIDAFATGVPHSGAVEAGSPDALIRHTFQGSWKHESD